MHFNEIKFVTVSMRNSNPFAMHRSWCLERIKLPYRPYREAHFKQKFQFVINEDNFWPCCNNTAQASNKCD